MSTPDRVTTHETFYNMKAKDVKRKDKFVVAFKTVTVLSNQKNTFGDRVITVSGFRTGSSNSTITLILPKNFPMNVNRQKTVVNKKN